MSKVRHSIIAYLLSSVSHSYGAVELDLQKAIEAAYYNEFSKAEFLLRSFRDKYPDHCRSLFLLSDVYRRQNKFTEAKERMTQYLTCSPHDADGKALFSDILMALGDLDAAIPFLEGLLQKEEQKKPEWFVLLGHAYNRIASSEKALLVLRNGISLYPKHSALYFEIGQTYFLLKNPSKAYFNFQAALQADPKREDIYADLVKSLLAARQDEKAEPYIKKLQTLGHAAELIYTMAALELVKAGYYEQALAYVPKLPEDAQKLVLNRLKQVSPTTR